MRMCSSNADQRSNAGTPKSKDEQETIDILVFVLLYAG